MGLRIDDGEGGPPPNGKPGDDPTSSTKGGGPPRAGRRESLTSSVLDRLEHEASQQRKLDGRKARAAWLILPYSRFLKIWLAIIGPLIVYNVIWVPLEVSQMASAGTVHGQIDFILDFFFYIDMVIIFRTAFVDRDNEIVLDGKVIAKRYVFKGSFVIDLIATLQWETIFTGQTAFSNTGSNDDGQASATAAFSVLRLPRMLRLLRLFKKLDMFPSLKVFKV